MARLRPPAPPRFASPRRPFFAQFPRQDSERGTREFERPFKPATQRKQR
jgi:hypothetical protein